MPVAQAAFSAKGDDSLFVVLGNFKKNFVGIFISNDRTQWNLDEFVFAIGSGRARRTAVTTVSGLDVTGKFQMEKRPQFAVADKINMSATTAIATIGSALFNELLPMQMRRAAAALSGRHIYFNVIYKVSFGQGILDFRFQI